MIVKLLMHASEIDLIDLFLLGRYGLLLVVF